MSGKNQETKFEALSSSIDDNCGLKTMKYIQSVFIETRAHEKLNTCDRKQRDVYNKYVLQNDSKLNLFETSVWDSSTTGNVVYIKIALEAINATKKHDSHFKRMNMKEVKIYERMSAIGVAPKIIGIHEWSIVIVETERHPWSLFEYLNRNTSGSATWKLPLKRECREIEQLIKLMHNNHVLHCDLHLSNIVVTKEFHFKIIDFGLAREFSSSPCSSSPSSLTNVADSISPEALSAIKGHYRKQWGVHKDYGNDPRTYDLVCYRCHHKQVKRLMIYQESCMSSRSVVSRMGTNWVVSQW
jgi:serine/threonine protein kinase